MTTDNILYLRTLAERMDVYTLMQRINYATRTRKPLGREFWT